MTDEEVKAELLIHLELHRATAAEIESKFDRGCAATHAKLAQAYARELLDMGVDERLLAPTSSIQ